LQAYSADLLAHLRGEEDHLQALPRKHMNLTLSKSIVTKVGGEAGMQAHMPHAWHYRGQMTVHWEVISHAPVSYVEHYTCMPSGSWWWKRNNG
jgi:hypothetical protein